MKKWFVAWLCCLAPALLWAAKVGQKAPDFTCLASDGKEYRLSDFKGKFVVLEWHNQGCPFVRKHYESGNMQKLQSVWRGKGVVWLSVISSAKGKEGYVTPEEESAYLKEKKASPTAVLLDSEGKLGHLYAAKTSPHMFVVNPEGILIYNGAIDDKSSTDPSDISSAKNYVNTALEEATAGKSVTTPSTPPYGCSVKYKK